MAEGAADIIVSVVGLSVGTGMVRADEDSDETASGPSRPSASREVRHSSGSAHTPSSISSASAPVYAMKPR